ncbi:hypothetical protein ACOQFV_03305 [Nocardiopsis changdeensis]|uniref:Uncharacterized protein n=1 Tax=Nocardiopsis changdeensis TaxID=2831969 RepID=A0ABX8BKQ0_9ACTN|nr:MULTISPECIES: hypothetical protein [Nocardiopsis]QUX22644.1 hypothetical protein KGD84_30875 [Nocardiopsis changdeensis]QYX38587.1 hypothetical protein K1J57_08255 [Nocardiopsis sp. MT53]
MSVMTDKHQDRARFTAALLGPDTAPEPTPLGGRVARGVVVDATSYMLCLATPAGEERFLYERVTSFWRGGEVRPTELRPGDDAVVRCSHDGRLVAERVWAQAARATGVITDHHDDTLEIDTGHGRPRLTVVIPYRASGRISVRHPRLESGYLFDAVGVWRDGAVWAVRPATTQPPYPLAATPRRPPTGEFSATLSGIATWYDPAWGRASHLDPRAHATGLAYPAIDRAGHTRDCDRRTSCVPLPLLSTGAVVGLRNDCTREAAALPVIDCAAADSWVCDLCPTCGGQGAGRLASLTMTSFVALGGRLEDGCFNATVTVHDGEV